MPKNIVVFSDGTGQAGGINFDEARTNVYKLYRACRVGPDTKVAPSEQVAFYDAGLGSASDGGHFKIGWMRWLYNLASMATGLGITRNIVDCYAAIIALYEDGDRVFLIGFSRGAYTVRSVAGVMTYCGVPRHMPDGSPLRRDPKSIHKLAERAVKDVYQFCPSYSRKILGYRRFLLETRDVIAAQFRQQYGSTTTIDGGERANVFPYFIGVFDTVAALGHKYLGTALVTSGIALLIGLHWLGGFLQPVVPWAGWGAWLLSYLGITTALIVFLKNYLKIAPSLPGYGILKRLQTVHFAPPKHKFYDTTLNPNVGYAKHAISIDENRADFKRVGWSPTAEKQDVRDAHGNLYFQQVWFPGVHADVGGGYLENEARLSDVALNWLLAGASLIPGGLKHDGSVLRLSPDPNGPQHNEQAGNFLEAGVRELPIDPKTEESRSPMHKSVYRRFEAGSVLLYELGGRTRARTWDPLIKRQAAPIDLSREFFQLSQNPMIRDQWLTMRNPTAKFVVVGRSTYSNIGCSSHRSATAFPYTSRTYDTSSGHSPDAVLEPVAGSVLPLLEAHVERPRTVEWRQSGRSRGDSKGGACLAPTVVERTEDCLFPEWEPYERMDGTKRWSQPLRKPWQYVKKLLKLNRAEICLYNTRHLMADWLNNEGIAQRTRDRILGHASDVRGRYGRKGVLDPQIAAKIEALEPPLVKQMREILLTAKSRADAAELIVMRMY